MTDLIRLHEGDSIDVLAGIPDGAYTAVVTDPPYGLSEPPPAEEVLVQWLLSGDFTRTKRGRSKAPPPGLSEIAARFKNTAGPGGFLGNHWDSFVPGPRLWREVYRTCRPGAVALVFAGTRTVGWMSVALMLAGFEILDMVGWITAQGMCKSGTIDKRIDARLGAERPVVGSKLGRPGMAKDGSNQRSGFDSMFGGEACGGMSTDLTAPGSPEAAEWEGWSTQLAPSIEPIIVARRPCEGTAVSNVLQHGCGAMNIAACLIGEGSTRRQNRADIGYGGGLLAAAADAGYATGSDAGRWPKNVMLDEVAADLLDLQVGERKSGARRAGAYGQRQRGDGRIYGECAAREQAEITSSAGAPSRYFWVGPCATEDDLALPFFYVPKVRFSGRIAGLPEGLVSRHPTMKPEALMRVLCRLVGHPKGRILDPFAGSGSTLRAARAESLPCDGIEREPDFARLARFRGGVATLRDFEGLAPLRLPTDPRSAADELER